MVQAVSAAIVGIGATEFSKFSGRSELRLALEACTTALSGAGIAPEEVDGLVAFAMDNMGGAVGMATPASRMAQSARCYLRQYGATSEDFGGQAVVRRNYANKNPAAFLHDRPLTLDEHQASRMIADPLHLFDCCRESGGGVALVLTASDRAKDLRQPPAAVLGAAMGIGRQRRGMATVCRDNIASAEETGVTACYRASRQLPGPDPHRHATTSLRTRETP
jgi:acetyl-CoA acetyltransferase